MKKESTKETLAFVKDIMEDEKDLDSVPNTIDNPLRLRWDDVTYQYKVSKSGDRSGLYVDLEVAKRLKEENALLIEALENAIDYWHISKESDGNFEQTEYELFLKAKELLTNLKNKSHAFKALYT